jgi:hypothetical protein
MTQLITNDDLAREYHRKRLLELSLKSIGEKLQLGNPTDEQKRWIKNKIKSRSWDN